MTTETREIEYAEGYAATVKPFEGRYDGRNVTGYGSKIATDYMVTFPDNPRSYRVYCICYSNCGSLYIVKGGHRLYLRGYELETALGR